MMSAFVTTGHSSSRRPDIQGLRALAILLVAAFHAGAPLPGGFVGVDVFFVISGFVITGLLLRRWQAAGRIDVGNFYLRRARRLLPALALMVSATVVASLLVQSANGAQQQTGQTGIGAMLMAANIVIPRLASDYFAPVAAANPLLHTWSLSAEEQFYLVYPWLLAIGLVLAARRRWPIAGAALAVGALTALSIGVAILSTYRPASLASAGVLAVPAFYASPARAWEFGAGALLALAWTRVPRTSPRALMAAGLAGLATVLAAAFIVAPRTPFPGVAAFAPVLGTLCLLASGAAGENAVVRMLARPGLVWIGDRSYSWYLWHWPAAVLARQLFPHIAIAPAVAVVAALIPACLSFRYVEQPIRVSPALGGRKLAALLAGTAAVPILLAAALGLGARAGWGQDWALAAHVALQKDCSAGAFDPVRCRWNVPDATGTVLLLGDSQAWAIADAVIPAAARLGFDTIVAAHNACPFVSSVAAIGEAGWTPFLGPLCAGRDQPVFDYVLAHPPRVAVIANQSRAYATKFAPQWRRSMSSAVKRLRSAGIGVIVVAVAPLADERSARLTLLSSHSADRFTPLAQQLAQRRDADGTDRFVAADSPGTVLFDPAAVLCSDGRCRVAEAGVELYSDQLHLSRRGALLLEPALVESLKASVAAAGRP